MWELLIPIVLVALPAVQALLPSPDKVEDPKKARRLQRWVWGIVIVVAIANLVKNYFDNDATEKIKQKNAEQKATIDSIRNSTLIIPDIQNTTSGIKDSLEINFANFRNLNTKLLELNNQTQISINKQEGALKRFDKVSLELNKIAEKEQTKIDLGRPEVGWANTNPYLKLVDSVKNGYSINFPIINIGARTASSVKAGCRFFEFEGPFNRKIIGEVKGITPASTPVSKLYSKDKIGSDYTASFSQFRFSGKIEDYTKGIYVYMYVDYVDEYNKIPYHLEGYFSWGSYKENKLSFLPSGMSDYNLIKKFMNEN